MHKLHSCTDRIIPKALGHDWKTEEDFPLWTCQGSPWQKCCARACPLRSVPRAEGAGWLHLLLPRGYDSGVVTECISSGAYVQVQHNWRPRPWKNPTSDGGILSWWAAQRWSTGRTRCKADSTCTYIFYHKTFDVYIWMYRTRFDWTRQWSAKVRCHQQNVIQLMVYDGKFGQMALTTEKLGTVQLNIHRLKHLNSTAQSLRVLFSRYIYYYIRISKVFSSKVLYEGVLMFGYIDTWYLIHCSGGCRGGLGGLQTPPPRWN